MNRIRRRSLLCLVLLVIGVSMIRCGETVPVRAADEPPKTVALVIDYADGVQKHFPQMRWKDGMTVLDLLEAAQKHPRGIRFEYRGRGATAFLLQIDDLKNEGRGRNWVYRVNGKLADRSFAVQKLEARDRVVWEFGEYREN